MWGFTWGCVKDMAQDHQRPASISLPGGALGKPYLQDRFMSLNQTQFDGPFDGCPAAIDVEFGVDAFGVRAHGTQGNHKFVSDLWPRQFRLEQAQDFKLALAEWFDEGGWCGRRCNTLASGLFLPHYLANIT